MSTLTAADLTDLGFLFRKSEEWWERDCGNKVVIVVDLTHTDPLVFVPPCEGTWATVFRGVRTRDDLRDLIRLLGESQ